LAQRQPELHADRLPGEALDELPHRICDFALLVDDPPLQLLGDVLATNLRLD
jgi:hypothetical protein